MVAPDARERFIYPDPGSSMDCGHANNCSPAQIAESFMESWQKDLESVLPNGGGIVCRDSTPFDGSAGDFACDGTGEVVVKIAWKELAAKSGEPVAHRVTNRLPLP